MKNRTQKSLAALISVVALALLLAACGGGRATGAPDSAQGIEGPADSGADLNRNEEPAAEEPAEEEAMEEAPPAFEGSGAGGGGDAFADDSDGAFAAPSGESGGAEAPSDPAITVPDQQFQVSLNAGEVDDNAEFSAYLQYVLDFNRFLGGAVTVHAVDVSERHTIRVTGSNGLPVLGAEVLVYNGQTLVTALRTPATGIVYFFPAAYTSSNDDFVVTVQKGGQSAEFDLTRGSNDAVWDVELGTRQNTQRINLDVMFLIDATGSMGPQIDQLKDNILSISAQIEALPANPNVRYGMVNYRDRGDNYVTRAFDFTGNVRNFQNDLNDVRASGGGDTPEAMNEGLHSAIADVDWRIEDTVSIIILVADAPPHLDYAQDYDYAQEMQTAAELGIKIFPIMADTGVEGFERDQAEYVLRQIAQFTGGHFIFVTSEDKPRSDGGEGSDVSVGEDDYRVENLDALVVRLIQQELEALTGGGQ